MDEWPRGYGTQFGDAWLIEPLGCNLHEIAQRRGDRLGVSRRGIERAGERGPRSRRNRERCQPGLRCRRTLGALRGAERMASQRIARQSRDHERCQGQLSLTAERGAPRPRRERAEWKANRWNGEWGQH